MKKETNPVNNFLKEHPELRLILALGIGIGALWASKYVFSMLAGSIRAFKELQAACSE
ncbi:hypothetical protein JYT59_00400 [Sphingobacteriaceae bacterium AH-315-L07]|nr:hypothetical protein [Sphingobacteriaceae bacterium AH-315-L07]